jgi:shikimate dehydrogenase
VRSSDRIWRDNNLAGGLGRYFPVNAAGSVRDPAAENPTVAMGGAAYRHPGSRPATTIARRRPRCSPTLCAGARAMGWIGFNCSIPTRSRRSTILDGLGESAALIGAVNCFVRRREKPVGENTEGRGFVTALRSFVDPSGNTVVLFGAGGAAHAVELAHAGASRIVVGNRSRPAQSHWLRF